MDTTVIRKRERERERKRDLHLSCVKVQRMCMQCVAYFCIYNVSKCTALECLCDFNECAFVTLHFAVELGAAVCLCCHMCVYCHLMCVSVCISEIP